MFNPSSRNVNCYYQIDFELKFHEQIDDEINGAQYLEKKYIENLILSQLPKYLEREHGIRIFIRINNYSKGSIIVTFSVLVAIFTVISGTKDLYEIIRIIIDFFKGRPKFSNINYNILNPTYNIASPSIDEKFLILQLITIILIVFLIGLSFSKLF